MTAPAKSDPKRAGAWIALLRHPVIRIVPPLVILFLAAIVLHRLSATVHLRDVLADLGAAQPRDLALAAGFTVASFAAISLYDVIASRAVAPGVIPVRVAAASCAAGYALSNLLGLSYVTGAAVRLRVYAGYGLAFHRAALIVVYAWSGFWAGLILLLALLFLAHPQGIAGMLPVPGMAKTALGLAMLGGLTGYAMLLAFGPGRIRVLGHDVTLPTLGPALALTGAGLGDLGAGALCLYVLMPADLASSFAVFFLVFVAAVALGVLSHAPGGLGVFEATILAGTGAEGRSDALAALLLFRVIYSVLPFVVASVALLVAELHSRRAKIGTVARATRDMVRPMVPLLAAGVALAAGTVLILSGNLPAIGERLTRLQRVAPLGLIELSHLVGSAAGVMLLVVARGLYRRLWRAWLVALVLLAVGIAASLAKGIDVEEAALMAMAAGVLWVFRAAFYRVEGAAPFRLDLGWFLSVAALFAGLSWVGLLAYRHVDYRDALWWQVTWSGDVSRFMRASLGGAILLGALGLNALLASRGPRHGPEPIPASVRRITAASPDSDANIALLGDKSFLIDPEERAFLAFADTGAALVALRDPVGDEDAAARLLWRLREVADREGKRAVFYSVTPRYLGTFLDMGFAVVKFGEVARVDLSTFSLEVPAMKGLRQARNRASREGYAFEILPAADFPRIAEALKEVSDAWLDRKQGMEKGFSLGRFDEAYLANFDTAVLRAPGTGRVTAFANVMTGARVEISVDLMRYDPSGPGFAMDALFAELMLWGQAQGFTWFNLGAAPFAGAETHALASPWQRLGGFVYAHGEDVYHFEGLRSYKDKFRPDWTPSYIACARGFGVPRALMDANLLISGGVAGLMHKGGTP